jgi:uncharacterized membrane protein
MRFLKIQRCLLATLLFTLSPVFCNAQDYVKEKKASYFTMSVPGALGTFPMALNDSMAVTGYYLASPTVAYGFVEDADGIITTFRVGGSIWTEPESINAAGEITGFYEVLAGVPRGFLRYSNGRIVTFDPPCVIVCVPSPQAQPVAINDFGEIAGNYPFPLASANGFRRSTAGVFTTFDFALGSANATDVTGLNASGMIVGYVSPGGSYRKGFLLHPDGFSTEFDVPVSDGSVGPGNEVTIPEGINADGAIAGWYGAEFLGTGGFVRSPQGVFTLFNPPGSIVTVPELGLGEESLTAPHRISISADGTIAGTYTDANHAQHGFVREPDGVITSFDPPRGMQTTATSINDSGVIAGSFYYDWNGQMSIGFLRIPTP